MILEVEEIWVDQTFECGSILRMSVSPAGYHAVTDGRPQPIYTRLGGSEADIAVAELRFVACIKQKAILELAALHSANFEPRLQAPSVSLISVSQQGMAAERGARMGMIRPAEKVTPNSEEFQYLISLIKSSTSESDSLELTN